MERTTLIFAALMALLSLSLTGTNTGTLADTNTGERPQIDTTAVYGADSDQRAAIAWALQRYEDAGISLPILEIYQHDSKSSCGEYAGLFTPQESIDRIDLCTDNMYIVLHELGHAWQMNFASEGVMKALLESYGDGELSGSDAAYRTRDEERAANVLAIGLIDVEMDDAGANLNRQLLDRFKLLTGVDSPRYVPDSGAND